MGISISGKGRIRGPRLGSPSSTGWASHTCRQPGLLFCRAWENLVTTAQRTVPWYSGCKALPVLVSQLIVKGQVRSPHQPKSLAQTLADTRENQKAEESLEQKRKKWPGRKKLFSEKKTEQRITKRIHPQRHLVFLKTKRKQTFDYF